MQKIFKRFYVGFIIFHFSLISLGNPENLENSLALFGKTLENLKTTIKVSKPSTPVIPKTPARRPIIPQRPVTPKAPLQKPITPEKSTAPQISQDDIGRLALQYTNEFRAQNGLKPLKWNQKIADLCMEHSKNMAEGKVPFGHDGFQNRVSRFPGRYRSAAENVFMTSSGGAVARDAVNGWIGSPGHRKNLLSNSTDCGIGAYKGQRGWYVTQMFASF